MSAEILFIQDLPYSAGLISQSFWFVEFKKIVQLIASGSSDEDIKKECLENNLLGAVKEYRAKRMYGYLWNRAKRIDDKLIHLFMDGDIGTQKLIDLIAIILGDKLYFEFIYEVYREKAILGQHEIDDNDLSVFFSNKGHQSELVENWNDSTKNHLKSNYINCMTDAGLIKIENKKRIITIPIIDDRLGAYLEQKGYHALLAALLGVV